MNDEERLWRRKVRLRLARFYGIVDLGVLGESDPRGAAREMVAGGVDVLQLRAKNREPESLEPLARSLRELTDSAGTLFLVNDWPLLARRVDADGVHLGQEDLPIAEARKILAATQLIGKSTHSMEQALAAEREGADYIAVGPIFATPTKPEVEPVGLPLIREVRGRLRKPFFCIGGIRKENLRKVLESGADRVVMVSAILRSADIEAYCREVAAMLGPKGLLTAEPADLSE
ncbi:thiamine-phosphate pyrophosphorylase [Methylacidimicrobium cyclopophantes]|uniref:Thiamine-phosphate synthase n=1 Tax=Methylacidimicrobium cyclopophantes TaxID=1041766 RepID=A0A5E6MJE7_9BACT|nr:thiamine phosphate synthase [Methylacidimicrobium cyclopophantes]VVM08450.1 thiamine-phosphate pyrophosphorylase [Methylacidimicrobium cyclopophantes]